MLSRTRTLLRPLALIVAAMAGASAHAIIDTTSMTDPGPIDTSFLYVGSFGQGSGVAVAPNMVLTAGHVAAGSFVLNGISYPVTNRVYSSTSDLQIVTVDTTNGALPGYYSIASSVAINSTISMVGVGATGVVNGDGTGYNVVNTFDRRAGFNTVDFKEYVNGYGPTLLSFLSGSGQAVLAGYDSGGGWFQDGMLVGTSDFQFKTTGNEGLADYGFANSAGTPYFGSGAIDLTTTDSRDFLTANGINPLVQAAPEPATCAALGLGALAVLRRRRRA